MENRSGGADSFVECSLTEGASREKKGYELIVRGNCPSQIMSVK